MYTAVDIIAQEQLEPRTWLRVVAERLSTVRYVFLVATEEGIPTVEQRSALEYSDAVLIGWPDNDSQEVSDLAEDRMSVLAEAIVELEKRIDIFRNAERVNDADVMADTLVVVSGYVAQVRKLYQPDFLLPTYAEIRRYVQQEWDVEMNRVDDAEAQTQNAQSGLDSGVSV